MKKREKDDDDDEGCTMEQDRKGKKDDQAIESDADEEDLAISDEDDDAEGVDPEIEVVESQGWEIVNRNRPTWLREKDEIADEEHREFFKIACKSSCNDPESWTHFNAEGNIDFKSILHLPSKSLQDFVSKECDEIACAEGKRCTRTKYLDLSRRNLHTKY